MTSAELIQRIEALIDAANETVALIVKTEARMKA